MAIANRLAITINGTVTADDKIAYAKAIDVNALSEMNQIASQTLLDFESLWDRLTPQGAAEVMPDRRTHAPPATFRHITGFAKRAVL